MRTIIAGSRSVTNHTVLQSALAYVRWPITTFVSGTASGADRLGEQYAKENGIPLKQFPADWKKYGKRAGYLRNCEMAKNADACIVLWDGRSKGAKMMMGIAVERGLALFVWQQFTRKIPDKTCYDGYRFVTQWGPGVARRKPQAFTPQLI